MAIARLLRWVLPAIALGVAACGSEDDRFDLVTPKPTVTPTVEGEAPAVKKEPVTRQESATIRGWSNSLRRGHVARAARYFGLPAVVANGTPLLRVETRAQAVAFNRALPCGARVVALERTVHHFVIATFRLTERRGPKPSGCGSGTGNLAKTAFLIRDGRIREWLRVPVTSTDAAAG